VRARDEGEGRGSRRGVLARGENGWEDGHVDGGGVHADDAGLKEDLRGER
jgi:hypothetical protein